MTPLHIRYRIGKRYVKTPRNREVQVILAKGKRIRIAGVARSVKQAMKVAASYQLRSQTGLNTPNVTSRYKRWDKAAMELAARAIKAGMKPGDDFRLWTGTSSSRKQANIYGTFGGSNLHSVKFRRKYQPETMAEDILKWMFKLAGQRLRTARLTSDTIAKFDLSTFHIQKIGHGEAPVVRRQLKQPARNRRKKEHPRKAKKSQHSTRKTRQLKQPARNRRKKEHPRKEKKSQHSTRKMTVKAKHSSHVLHGGKAIKRRKSLQKRSTAKAGGRR